LANAATLLITTLLALSRTASADTLVETRVYRKWAAERKYLNTYHIERNGKELFVRILSHFGEQIHIQKELWLDQNYATLKWKYRDMKEGIDIFAQRDGNTIWIRGINRGRKVDKTYRIDSLPWKQQFPFDLEQFIRSDQDSLMFWSIGVDGPANMKIAKLVARKKESGTVRVNGEETEAIRVSVSFTELLSLIWHGDAWHRVSDGRFIYFKSSSAPGHPPMIFEMLEEKKMGLSYKTAEQQTLHNR
jgi:hypothetical protein